MTNEMNMSNLQIKYLKRQKNKSDKKIKKSEKVY